MAIPEEIKALKPLDYGAVEIRCISGHFYVYEISSRWDPAKGKARKVTGKSVGKITLKDGFIPNEYGTRQITPLHPLVKNYGVYAILRQLSGSLEKNLKDIFPDIYREISVVAMLQLVTGCRGKRIKREFEASYLNDIHPDLSCSDYTVRNLVGKLGTRSAKMAAFMRLNVKPGSKLMFDGTSIFTRADDSFAQKGYSPEHKKKTQVRLLYIFDRSSYTTHVVDPTTNPTVPGRDMHNLTEEDMVEIEKITDKLMAGADPCHMERDAIIKSVKLYYACKKQMDVHDCNAFVMPCPDACATRRLNEEQYTACLTHSLNNEQAIPSACEYDIGALVVMAILSNLSNSAAYMGNTNPMFYDEDGNAKPFRVITEENLKDIKTLPNLYWTFHSTPNRKLKGFDKPLEKYGIESFAYSGWGATLRYDFAKDAGQVITMARISPDCSKLLIAKGTIVGGGGFDQQNCSQSVIFTVNNREDLFYKQIKWGGNHLPLVYGDYTKELLILADILGLEPIVA